MPEPSDQLAWINEALAELDRQTLRRYPATCAAQPGGKLVVESQASTSEELANFGANDYLALARDPRLAEAAERAANEAGWGAGASPLITGRTPWHTKLQAAIATFEGTEAALLFTSGFAANAGTIPALVERGDAVFGDQKNHASIIDGCRLSKAEVFIYPHADCTALEKMLQTSAGEFRRRLIVTDTLFSMDGNLAPLPRLCELATQYDAMLMVDEAHATGVFGANGRGVAEHLGVKDRVDVRVGTLSKALGSHGGFVAGSQTLIDYLANRARSYVFATAPPAALAAASMKAVELVRSEPWRREQLLAKAARVREALRSQGWNIGQAESQIVPILIGTPERTLQLSAELRQRGFFIPAIRPPSVPAGESLLRLSLSYGHSDELLEELLGHLKELSKLARSACE
jgi:8-amino-7-oxononanoate synthase